MLTLFSALPLRDDYWNCWFKMDENVMSLKAVKLSIKMD